MSTISRLALLAAGVLLLFQPSRSGAAAAGVFPLKVSANGRYLVDQNNVPFLISGDSAWSLIAQGTNSDIDTYLADRQQRGINLILVNLLEHKFATNAPADILGDLPFTGVPFQSAPNETYFQHADYLVAQAAQRGMAVLLSPLYLGFDCGDEGWCAEVGAASTANMQDWGTYVGTRYATYDNIIWSVGGDTDPNATAGVAPRVAAFATSLAAADTRHLITAHNLRGEMAITPWSGASWLTLNDTYATYTALTAANQTAYGVSPVMPFFLIEGWYENEHEMTTQALRAQVYWTMLEGGAGSMFGNCPLWGLGSPPTAAPCPNATQSWTANLDTPGAAGMKHATDLFNSVPWYTLLPDWNHTLVTAGFGAGGTDFVAAGLTPDGGVAVAYLPTVRTLNVNLGAMSGPINAQWYDVTSGAYSPVAGSPFLNSGSQQLTPPGPNAAGDGDWVLVLQGAAPASPTPATPVPTNTPTSTPLATNTPTVTPPATNTPTLTPRPTSTPTVTPTGTPLPFCIPGDPSPCAAPIHWWAMNENAGSTTADRGSSPVSGTLNGNPTWSAGEYGSALTFNKSNQYVQIGNSHLNGATQLTFEAWVKRKAASAIVAVGEETTASNLDASLEAYSDGNVYMNIGTGATIADAFFRSNDTNWHHVAFVFDGMQSGNSNRLKAYLDGVQQKLNFDGTTIPASIRTSDTNFSIGALSGSHDFSNGTLDDVRIYAYPRTAAQILRDKNNNT